MTKIKQELEKVQICLLFKTSIFQNDIDEVISDLDLTEQDLNLLEKKELPVSIDSLVNKVVCELDGLSECEYDDDCG